MEEILRDTVEALKRIEEEVNKIFRDITLKYPSIGFPLGIREPLMDVEDRETEYVIYVDVPGFKKEDLKITVGDNYIEIFATKSEEEKKEVESRKYIVRQRLYESIKKRIELPTPINPEEAKASLNNGVLVVRLPKRRISKEITIDLGSQ
ncbi:MAG: hypothetical protein DRJ39_03320 [Thermoprotei archaeon]|nr:Hsp20/alpha crystallin family protein [Thermoproteales archaeon]RLE75310.1 MAG: hypothetical protein DRZ80_03040 [Thermoprotei archaeon]RLE77717.1 MAG: hypothetical protein DRJ44_01430 [Thermoprotei archaeon]RLE84335.1 MAG: hypothetical protein DRJ39_03320 [Thermoprotei archaeon]